MPHRPAPDPRARLLSAPPPRPRKPMGPPPPTSIIPSYTGRPVPVARRPIQAPRPCHTGRTPRGFISSFVHPVRGASGLSGLRTPPSHPPSPLHSAHLATAPIRRPRTIRCTSAPAPTRPRGKPTKPAARSSARRLAHSTR